MATRNHKARARASGTTAVQGTPQPSRFPEWAELNALGRFLTSVAVRHGIEVVVNEYGHWEWRGTEDQFKATQLWEDDAPWGQFVRFRSFWTPRGMRGRMRWVDRANKQMLYEEIRFLNELDGSRLRGAAAHAKNDQDWTRFKTAALTTVDLGDETEEASPPVTAADQWWARLTENERGLFHATFKDRKIDRRALESSEGPLAQGKKGGGMSLPFSPARWARMEFGQQLLLTTAINDARTLYEEELDAGHDDSKAGVNAYYRLRKEA